MPESTITKKALSDSLKQLLKNHPLEKISVGEICEGCGLSRKSFYYHFKDKYDLVNWIFYYEFMPRAKARSYENGWDFFEDLCTYFHENRAFYIKAFALQGQNSFTEFFGEFLQPIAFNYLKQSFAENESNEFYADFFTDAFRVAIIRWLKEDSDMSPAQIVGLFKFAAVGASSSIIKKEPSPNT